MRNPDWESLQKGKREENVVVVAGKKKCFRQQG
jgi:hypothetical protein